MLNPSPSENSGSPSSSPARLVWVILMFWAGLLQRVLSWVAFTCRWMLNPQVPRPGRKMMVRMGIRISADQVFPSWKVAASQMPSQFASSASP